MLVGVAAFLGSEVVLSPVVSGCLPSCGGWVLVGVAASRTKIFRNQNHRFQSKFAYCKLFGVYAGVIFCCALFSIRRAKRQWVFVDIRACCCFFSSGQNGSSRLDLRLEATESPTSTSEISIMYIDIYIYIAL